MQKAGQGRAGQAAWQQAIVLSLLEGEEGVESLRVSSLVISSELVYTPGTTSAKGPMKLSWQLGTIWKIDIDKYCLFFSLEMFRTDDCKCKTFFV